MRRAGVKHQRCGGAPALILATVPLQEVAPLPQCVTLPFVWMSARKNLQEEFIKKIN